MWESNTSAQRASSAVLRYGVAVSSVAAALVLTLLLHPDRLFAPVFFLAIILTAWIGGIGPGLVAALLATDIRPPCASMIERQIESPIRRFSSLCHW